MNIDEALRIGRAMEGDSPRAEAVFALVERVEQLAAAWAPVTLPWRHTLPGDAFIGAGGSLWRITESRAVTNGQDGGQWRLDVARAGEVALSYDGDPDETVDVLVPVDERDAFVLLRAELGARLVERAAA